jgi:hypothetical protein
MRYWLKECPRCHGDLREERDIHGPYVACLQCGYILPPAAEVELMATDHLRRTREVEDAIAA